MRVTGAAQPAASGDSDPAMFSNVNQIKAERKKERDPVETRSLKRWFEDNLSCGSRGPSEAISVSRPTY